jgi:hypothetical protein
MVSWKDTLAIQYVEQPLTTHAKKEFLCIIRNRVIQTCAHTTHDTTQLILIPQSNTLSRHRCCRNLTRAAIADTDTAQHECHE